MTTDMKKEIDQLITLKPETDAKFSYFGGCAMVTALGRIKSGSALVPKTDCRLLLLNYCS